MLVADPRLLGFILGAGQDERAAAIGFNDYPSLVSLILVDHEGKTEDAGVPVDGLVIVAYQQ